MTDEEEIDMRKELKKAASILAGGEISHNATVTNQGTIGQHTTPVDAYLNEDSLSWLHAQLQPDGVAYLDTVELQTEDGTVVFEAEDGVIELRYKEEE